MRCDRSPPLGTKAWCHDVRITSPGLGPPDGVQSRGGEVGWGATSTPLTLAAGRVALVLRSFDWAPARSPWAPLRTTTKRCRRRAVPVPDGQNDWPPRRPAPKLFTNQQGENPFFS